MSHPAQPVQQLRHHPGHRRLREQAYPSLAEFADAFYWQQRGDPAPMQAWLAKVDLVKARYPK
jgi:hypothetical protein